MLADTTQPLHYYHGIERLRYVGSWMVTVLTTIGFGTAGILISFLDRRGAATHACARLWGRSFLWICGIVLRVEGRAHLDPTAAYVFVSDHHSALDIPALLVALPTRFRMLAKASLFRVPFLGWYMRRVGYVAVDRSDHRQALRSVQAAAAQAGDGVSILVFPEGTRTREGQLGRFKKGGIYIARNSGLALVPVAIVNSGGLLARGERWPDPGTIEVHIGEPIEIPRDADPTRLAELVHRKVERLRAARLC